MNNENLAKRAARLAAVQALYGQLQTAASGTVLDGQLAAYLSTQAKNTDIETASLPAEPDRELFTRIVRGVLAHIAELDEMIAASYAVSSNPARLEDLLRIILRAGAYELWQHGEVDGPIIINDYVEVTHAYYMNNEPKMINGTLDNLQKHLRAK